MKRSSTPLRVGGFTLLELMIVVVIVAILAAIAIPAYGRYAFRARRGEGQEFLMKLSVAQERYYATFNKYAQDPVADLKFTTNTSEHNYYVISIGQLTGLDFSKGYIATATPQTAQVGDVCGNLMVDSRGVKSQSGQTDVNGKCW